MRAVPPHSSTGEMVSVSRQSPRTTQSKSAGTHEPTSSPTVPQSMLQRRAFVMGTKRDLDNPRMSPQSEPLSPGSASGPRRASNLPQRRERLLRSARQAGPHLEVSKAGPAGEGQEGDPPVPAPPSCIGCRVIGSHPNSFLRVPPPTVYSAPRYRCSLSDNNRLRRLIPRRRSLG